MRKQLFHHVELSSQQTYGSFLKALKLSMQAIVFKMGDFSNEKHQLWSAWKCLSCLLIYSSNLSADFSLKWVFEIMIQASMQSFSCNTLSSFAYKLQVSSVISLLDVLKYVKQKHSKRYTVQMTKIISPKSWTKYDKINIPHVGQRKRFPKESGSGCSAISEGRFIYRRFFEILVLFSRLFRSEWLLLSVAS